MSRRMRFGGNVRPASKGGVQEPVYYGPGQRTWPGQLHGPKRPQSPVKKGTKKGTKKGVKKK